MRRVIDDVHRRTISDLIKLIAAQGLAASHRPKACIAKCHFGQKYIAVARNRQHKDINSRLLGGASKHV